MNVGLWFNLNNLSSLFIVEADDRNRALPVLSDKGSLRRCEKNSLLQYTAGLAAMISYAIYQGRQCIAHWTIFSLSLIYIPIKSIISNSKLILVLSPQSHYHFGIELWILFNETVLSKHNGKLLTKPYESTQTYLYLFKSMTKLDPRRICWI